MASLSRWISAPCWRSGVAEKSAHKVTTSSCQAGKAGSVRSNAPAAPAAGSRLLTGRSADYEEEVPAFDGLDWLGSEPGHSAVQGRGDGRFHLHGLDGRDYLPGRDRAPLRHLEGHGTDERGGNMPRDRAVGFLGGVFRRLLPPVPDRGTAELT